MREPNILVDRWGNVHIEHTPLDLPCHQCGGMAVFHQCNAHGFPFEAHPHGGIHRLDGPVGVVYLCRECGTRMQRENDQIIRLSKYLRRGWL